MVNYTKLLIGILIHPKKKYPAIKLNKRSILNSSLKYMMLKWFLEEKEDITKGRGREGEIQAKGITKTLRCKHSSVQKTKTAIPGECNMSGKGAKRRLVR